MLSESEKPRPNIRIQIVNNVSEMADAEEKDQDQMEVDAEEGEITDDAMEESDKNGDSMKNLEVSSVKAIFTTGINIFDKKEQEKLQERARRFALKPEEINSFNDQDLQNLYESLGINSTNENEFKFKIIHLLGLDEMTSQDIVDYFASYAPEGIEWLDQKSCNVVWLDNLSAARALNFKSRVVKGMPAREPKDTFPKEFLDDIEDEELENGQSILIKNQNREIELLNEIGEIILPKKKTYPENAVDISEVTIPIPPGYWRLGLPHPRTKCLLMRFGKITDKIPFKVEKCNKYYKILTNPSQRKVISESKKKELKTIFERNKELNQSKNPWGSLAKNWDKDSKFRERDPATYNKLDKDSDEVHVVEVKNPKLQARLGTKRKYTSDDEQIVEEPIEEKTKKEKFAKERKKLPRMKMYADEEEENRKRNKILLRIQKQTEEIEKTQNDKDLRNMLGPSNKLLFKKDLIEPDFNVDLASRLKNRSRRMIFAVERDLFDQYNGTPTYPDVRSELIERSLHRQAEAERERERSTLASRSIFFRSRLEERNTRVSPQRHSRHRSSRHRTPERTLHSDHLHLSRRLPHSRKRSYSPEIRHSDRTKSKIVVKTEIKKPTVASTIWSKVQKQSESDKSSSESESESEESSKNSSSSSSSDQSESDSSDSDSSTQSSRRIRSRNPDRPGFDKSRLSLSKKIDHRSPLKITTTNEHFGRRSRK